MKLIDLERAIEYAKEKDYIKMSSQEKALREVFELATVEAIPIPDNATNGEVIMKVTGEYYLTTSNRCETIEIEIGGRQVEFDGKWWNTPYKESEE